MLTVIGGCLFWGVIPPKLRGGIFDGSRKCIGAAIMVMPLSTLVVYFLSLRTLMYNLHVASYLTACYLISILVTVGLVPLLGDKFNFRHPHFRRRFIRGLLGVPIFALPMVLANIYGNEQSAEVAKLFTALLLFTAMTYQSVTFSRLYREAIRRGNNYYSEDIEVDIKWIIKSVVALFTLEIICASSIFFPSMGYEAEMALTIYRAVTIAYVFAQFVKFMKNFEDMMSACEIDDEAEEQPNCYKALSAEQQEQIAWRLEKWKAQKKYTQRGVTIDDVAAEVATNRTYLSIYINTTFNSSFKVWVTSLRVEYAKSLLVGDDTTVDISRVVGFSSPQSFMHSFKRVEGCTPTQWRKINND